MTPKKAQHEGVTYRWEKGIWITGRTHLRAPEIVARILSEQTGLTSIAHTGAFHVYVIELSERAGQRLLPDKPVVYVGQTWLLPEDRLWKHFRGEHASRWVRNYGLRLRPDLAKGVPRLQTRAQALEWEARLTKELEAQGYIVKGGH